MTNHDRWFIQIRKGLAELAVMILMKDSAVYGYQLTKALKTNPMFELSDGSIYPLLKRLEANQLVDTYWDNPDTGLRRKYYQLSKKGAQVLSERLNLFQESMDLLWKLQKEVTNDEDQKH
ncbi:PadR family transcriptional regulator [Virgibacillus chiguensis]|uniref:PadR family transcriptional regulator, regulatory protein PadR n=1 Tax=Virgibacillus chiguensis TaxID=411959 RepID=A0A1M5X779_9BACI|nr:PadR family transcriptional regulator [Virgibacillus chiguensis]SHH95083.1 PadR family transcriptional regulator, regulatory protein PadR [Virgibacillus chiguensis]